MITNDPFVDVTNVQKSAFVVIIIVKIGMGITLIDMIKFFPNKQILKFPKIAYRTRQEI